MRDVSNGSTAVEIGSDQLFPLWDLKADIACDEVIVRRSSQWHRPLCYTVDSEFTFNANLLHSLP